MDPQKRHAAGLRRDRRSRCEPFKPVSSHPSCRAPKTLTPAPGHQVLAGRIRYADQAASHILVQEIVCNLDDATNEAVLLIHWTGGRHTEVRVPRVKTGRYPSDIVQLLSKLSASLLDIGQTVSSPSRLNRMRCKTSNGETWTPGRRSVCAKCANVSASRNTIRPEPTPR